MSDDDIAFNYLRKLVSQAIWQVLYHSDEIKNARPRIAIAAELLRLSGVNGEDVSDDEEDDASEYTTLEELARGILASAKATLKYQEEQLRDAHHDLANLKILLARGNFPDIDFAEIEQKERARLNKKA